MSRNFAPMDDEYADNYGMDEFQNEKDFSNDYISYPENNRYNNAYGNYRGGYDRGHQGPPLGFGPSGPMPPPDFPLPPFPMPSDMRWRRGYPEPPGNIFTGPRRDKIVKYLLRCGISREHVVNLPNDLLAMMQPMNCGLCSQKFESSDLSRIHYASKNHLKNQKKWVNQRTDSASLHSKEPIKSRDLYCELCDVHITSTGHADSHYAGKPHRSIVEGRKNPRNPFLLLPNKQGRLKALIRRELKFLKKNVPAPVEKKSLIVIKTSDLYCEICKTSMMCSEQMTTHLNGKRHLSKEKQHILRLMKGEVPADDKKNNSKVNTGDNAKQAEEIDADEDDEEEEKGDDLDIYDDKDNKTKKSVVEADDDDWGEGGEDWKPSAEDY